MIPRVSQQDRVDAARSEERLDRQMGEEPLAAVTTFNGYCERYSRRAELQKDGRENPSQPEGSGTPVIRTRVHSNLEDLRRSRVEFNRGQVSSGDDVRSLLSAGLPQCLHTGTRTEDG